MRSVCLLLFWIAALCGRAGGPVASFTENRGQWPQQVLYRVLLPDGALFIEREAFTYVLQRGGGVHHHTTEHHEEPFRAHVFKVHFRNGRANAWSGGTKAGRYENFFLGSDPAKWGTGCGVFGEVTLHDVWPGIDLHVDGRTGLKYAFIVAPGADPAAVQLVYEGHDALALNDGRCVVRTTAGDVIEEAPVSYYADDAAREPVPTWFKLRGNELSFGLPGELDGARPLVIDPILSFGSYSGSTADNFGFTATYDAGGHLYGGGIVFGIGYPTTVGVQDASFNGGMMDVGISKWTPDGSDLVWSTYIGGSGNEAPHSMVVNAQDELFVMGSTGSPNFPITPGAYDANFNGGTMIDDWTPVSSGYGFEHFSGTDIFVTRFNVGATALIGSTFVGGSGNDGLNTVAPLAHNYGDHFRGEIIIDANGDPVIATTTRSTDLPVIDGPQAAFGGGTQDGYCFRMDPSLSAMLWSTYIGGSGIDAAYGVQVDSGGDLFVTGGTTSGDLPMAGSPFQGMFSGGTDGFIMRYGTAGGLAGSTYLGTSAYDQSYFVQLNTADEVFVVGQTRGNYPVTPGRYAVPGSSQFIHKLEHSLSASLWSTRFGNGSPDQDLSPTAFLVSDCGQIYFSGWGGSTNGFAGIHSSTTFGTAVTPDAFQSTTDGSDFYLMVLEPEATALNYATFFGGSSGEHVDGGTSRFDKSGTVYQAVCAGCQGVNDFPTTPSAWSRTNNSTNCNLGVMKFDLLATVAVIGIDGPAEVCPSSEVRFTNTSVGGDTYTWDFGDGATSTEAAPTHTYHQPGAYTVTMHLSDGTGCARPDSADLVVTVIVDPPVQLDPVDPICPEDTVHVNVSSGRSWAWSPTTGVSDPAAQDPVLTPQTTTTYQVVVTGACTQDTASLLVEIIVPVGSAGPDHTICAGGSIMLDASGGGTYVWEPAATLSSTTEATPMASPMDSTAYMVAITSPDGCVVRDTVIVFVDQGLPMPALADTVVCEGGTATLVAPAGRTHLWTAGPAQGLTTPAQTHTPQVAAWWVVQVSNACGTLRDSAFVDIRVPVAWARPDTTVCAGLLVQLHSAAGEVHDWQPVTGLSDPTARSPIATVDAPITYTVLITDDLGCAASGSVTLATHPVHPVTALWDQVIEPGQVAQLLAVGDGTFAWAPAATLSDSTIATPVARPEQSTTYTVYLTDLNGCITADEVSVLVPGRLFIPNTFTPNGDGYNDVFGAWGVDIVEFQLDVFDRWGKLIWTTPHMGTRWDGRFGGQDAPIDTYVWKMHAKEITGGVIERVGHVNLVR